jgi:hypothetical protein
VPHNLTPNITQVAVGRRDKLKVWDFFTRYLTKLFFNVKFNKTIFSWKGLWERLSDAWRHWSARLHPYCRSGRGACQGPQ